MCLPVMISLMYRVVGKSQGFGCHWMSFKRRCEYVGQILNIFDSNSWTAANDQNQRKKQPLKLWFPTLVFSYRIGI